MSEKLHSDLAHRRNKLQGSYPLVPADTRGSRHSSAPWWSTFGRSCHRTEWHTSLCSQRRPPRSVYRLKTWIPKNAWYVFFLDAYKWKIQHIYHFWIFMGRLRNIYCQGTEVISITIHPDWVSCWTGSKRHQLVNHVTSLRSRKPIPAQIQVSGGRCW